MAFKVTYSGKDKAYMHWMTFLSYSELDLEKDFPVRPRLAEIWGHNIHCRRRPTIHNAWVHLSFCTLKEIVNISFVAINHCKSTEILFLSSFSWNNLLFNETFNIDYELNLLNILFHSNFKYSIFDCCISMSSHE